MTTPQAHLSLWATAGGPLRYRLPGARRHDEARGDQESACQERYEVAGTHIE